MAHFTLLHMMYVRMHSGYTGLCSDSAAIVEAAVEGRTSVFPTIISGAAKGDLLVTARDILSSGGTDPDATDDSITRAFAAYDDEASAVADGEEDGVPPLSRIIKAIMELPNDADIAPTEIPDACRRVEATLPESSPFTLVERCRQQSRLLSRFWSYADAGASAGGADGGASMRPGGEPPSRRVV